MEKGSNIGAEPVFLNFLFVPFSWRPFFLPKHNNLPDKSV